jgi:carboxyl-terminal processing protease
MNQTNCNRGPTGSKVVLIFALGVIGGMVLDRLAVGAIGVVNAAADFRLISEAWQIVRNEYVDRAKAQPRTMAYGAISGMVDALGDTGHSRFLSPEMAREVSVIQRNKFDGIGAKLQEKAGNVVIVAPLDDSPAQRAGLRPGDIILEVNGKEVNGLPLDKLVTRVSGPAGTQVTLRILNPSSGSTRDVTLVRAAITIHNVTWHQLPGSRVAHLRIAGFGHGMTEDLRLALAEIRRANLDGIILDLRNNPGGLLDEAVGATSQFLRDGNVLLEKNASGTIKSIPVISGGAAVSTPLVVLINNGTASAAEIMAGALGAAHRAKTVGDTTFGTGTVLHQFSLSDGAALLLAVGEWLTPDGQAIWHKGINPDIKVTLPAGASPVRPAEEENMTVAQFNARQDKQLVRALGLLGVLESTTALSCQEAQHRGGQRP